MPKVEPSFILYALLLEPGGCLRAHITLFELVEPEKKKKKETIPLLPRGLHKRPATLRDPGSAVGDTLKPLVDGCLVSSEHQLAKESDIVCRLLVKLKRVLLPGGMRGQHPCPNHQWYTCAVQLTMPLV